jgi:hypothetical protein
MWGTYEKDRQESICKVILVEASIQNPNLAEARDKLLDWASITDCSVFAYLEIVIYQNNDERLISDHYRCFFIEKIEGSFYDTETLFVQKENSNLFFAKRLKEQGIKKVPKVFMKEGRTNENGALISERKYQWHNKQSQYISQASQEDKTISSPQSIPSPSQEMTKSPSTKSQEKKNFCCNKCKNNFNCGYKLKSHIFKGSDCLEHYKVFLQADAFEIANFLRECGNPKCSISVERNLPKHLQNNEKCLNAYQRRFKTDDFEIIKRRYEAMRKRLSSRFERKKKENEAFNKAITASYIRMKSICIGCKASFQSMKEHLETSDKCLSEYGKLFVNELNPRFTLSEVLVGLGQCINMNCSSGYLQNLSNHFEESPDCLTCYKDKFKLQDTEQILAFAKVKRNLCKMNIGRKKIREAEARQSPRTPKGTSIKIKSDKQKTEEKSTFKPKNELIIQCQSPRKTKDTLLKRKSNIHKREEKSPTKTDELVIQRESRLPPYSEYPDFTNTFLTKLDNNKYCVCCDIPIENFKRHLEDESFCLEEYSKFFNDYDLNEILFFYDQCPKENCYISNGTLEEHLLQFPECAEYLRMYNSSENITSLLDYLKMLQREMRDNIRLNVNKIYQDYMAFLEKKFQVREPLKSGAPDYSSLNRKVHPVTSPSVIGKNTCKACGHENITIEHLINLDNNFADKIQQLTEVIILTFIKDTINENYYLIYL